ncbi:MAG: tRNA-dihydrouridine synthase family protein [Candidatus ainarchaeum sp.]|nr:tRNA-dihydrouridine synthase family protein [Candidatus ainarchaeum sp.]
MNKFFSKLDKGAFLAPMADYTNIAFRTLAKENGAALLYTELISVKAINFNSKKTIKMMQVSEIEKPVFLQLFGNNLIDFASAIKKVEQILPNNFAGYDLNCGCSVLKAIKGNYGVKLMDYPKLVSEIIKEMKSVTSKPVTIKMRLGLKDENFLEVSQEAIDAGVDGICLHARFGTDGYSGKANWEKIKELRNIIPKRIPVIGNGDVTNLDDYLKIKKETNCDFVMIGRGAIGNAFLFKQIKEYEKNEKLIEKKKIDNYLEAKRYLEIAKKFDLEINSIRPYFIGVATGFIGAKDLRLKFALSKNVDEIENLIEELN